jgi:hypothetical protein
MYLISTFGINHLILAVRFPLFRSPRVGPPIRAKGLAQLRNSVKWKAALGKLPLGNDGETCGTLRKHPEGHPTFVIPF